VRYLLHRGKRRQGKGVVAEAALNKNRGGLQNGFLQNVKKTGMKEGGPSDSRWNYLQRRKDASTVQSRSKKKLLSLPKDALKGISPISKKKSPTSKKTPNFSVKGGISTGGEEKELERKDPTLQGNTEKKE